VTTCGGLEAADRTGNLRAIVEALRFNPAEDESSNMWSTLARPSIGSCVGSGEGRGEVRRAHRHDPVRGPSSGFDDSLVTNEFLAIIDERNRKIVILLNCGFTKAAETAEALGCAHRSAVFKRLTTIRATAGKFFDAQHPPSDQDLTGKGENGSKPRGNPGSGAGRGVLHPLNRAGRRDL
jgi:hypothetical protein